MTYEQIDTTSPFSDPDYPEKMVAFIVVRSTTVIPVQADAHVIDDAPPDADARGGGRPRWIFGERDANPAHFVPDRVWRGIHDLLLAVDASSNPVGAGREQYRESDQTAAEKLLAAYRIRLNGDGDGGGAETGEVGDEAGAGAADDA